VELRHLSAAALLAACGGVTSAQSAPDTSRQCTIHVYPADGVHSVGEDFDAIHDTDQDLHDYYRNAGRPLDWLTPDRQIAILDSLSMDRFPHAAIAARTIHREPLTRHQALEPGPRESADGCIIEVMLPQIMLERGGLARRSLRVFGVIRRYDGGTLRSSYSGYSAVAMTGFQLKSPNDATAATAVVERAYRDAVDQLLRNSAKPKSR
jgi:hypothetical protein